MARELVTRDELTAYLTAELQKREDCGECTISGIKPLLELDEDGCNWSEEVLIQRAGVSHDHVLPHAWRIITEARKRFNLRMD